MQPDPILTECLDLLRTCRDLLSARNRGETCDLSHATDSQRVLEMVAQTSGVDVITMLRKDRTELACRARDTAVWLMHETCGMGWKRIGRAMLRDHGTAMNSYRNAQNRIDTEPAYARWINELKRTITTTFPPSAPIGNEPKQSSLGTGRSGGS